MTVFTIIAITLAISGATFTAIKEIRSAWGSRIDNKITQIHDDWRAFESRAKNSENSATKECKGTRSAAQKAYLFWRWMAAVPIFAFAFFAFQTALRVKDCLSAIRKNASVPTTLPTFEISIDDANYYWWWLVSLMWIQFGSLVLILIAGIVIEQCAKRVARDLDAQKSADDSSIKPITNA